MMRGIFLFLFTIFSTLHSANVSETQISDQIRVDLQDRLSSNEKSIVVRLYKLNGYRALWNDSRLHQLSTVMKNPLFNYKNRKFDTKSIKEIYYLLDNSHIEASKYAKAISRADIAMTDSFVRLVKFVVKSDVNWDLVLKKLTSLKASDDIKANWEISPHKIPPLHEIYSAIKDGRLYDFLDSLLPMKKRAKRLVKILKKYKKLPPFVKLKYYRKKLRLGMRDARVSKIKRRLRLSGEYPADAPVDNNFDYALDRAVRIFQKEHLLKANGVVDVNTIHYMNTPRYEIIKKIVLNLDKTKLYPKQMPTTRAEVNIPDFTFRYFEDDELALKMRAIVGRIDRPTPIFRHDISYFVLNPTWTIPDNLVRRDLIHVLQENPEYLSEHDIKVYKANREVEISADDLLPYLDEKKGYIPYRFVQQPSNQNALGLVKFMFPNRYAVYLHDTDNRSLFKYRYRVFSSGCMRISEPFEFMDLLLKRTKKLYTKEDIEKIFDSGKTTTIKVEPLPFFVNYFTVVKDGSFEYFLYDIYAYDKLIYESSEGHIKEEFELPKKRLVSVKKTTDRLSN